MFSDFVASTKLFVFPLELLLTSQNPPVHFKILPSPNKTLVHSASNLQFNFVLKDSKLYHHNQLTHPQVIKHTNNTQKSPKLRGKKHFFICIMPRISQ